MERKKTIDIIVSIVVAIVLWFYVINIVNPTITGYISSVPVTITGTDVLSDNNLAIAGSGNYTVSLTITGTRSTVNSVSAEDFTASADVSDLSLGQGYITVSVDAPRGVTITEVKSEKIQVYVDSLVSNNVSVKVSIGDCEGGYEGTITSIANNSVAVYGAQSLVQQVSEVRCSLDTALLKVEDIGIYQLTLTPYDSNGKVVEGVKCNPETVSVNATIYPTKEVPLYAVYTGTPGYGATVKSASIPETLLIKGPQSQLDQIDMIFSDSINIEGIVSNSDITINVLLDDGVYLSRTNKTPTASFVLSEDGIYTAEYSLNDIEIEGLTEGYSYDIIGAEDDKIIATIVGPLRTIKSLSNSDTAPVIEITTSAAVDQEIKDVKISSAVSTQDVDITYSPAAIDIKVIAPNNDGGTN